MRSETSSGSGEDEFERKGKVERETGGESGKKSDSHTCCMDTLRSEEAEMRFPGMLLQFLMPVCQH